MGHSVLYSFSHIELTSSTFQRKKNLKPNKTTNQQQNPLFYLNEKGCKISKNVLSPLNALYGGDVVAFQMQQFVGMKYLCRNYGPNQNQNIASIRYKSMKYQSRSCASELCIRAKMLPRLALSLYSTCTNPPSQPYLKRILDNTGLQLLLLHIPVSVPHLL